MRSWLVAATLLIAITAPGHALLMSGPTLDLIAFNWYDSGIRMTALQDVTLTGFVFHNQGNADTIRLRTTSGTDLHTLGVGAGNAAFSATVDWQLSAGTQYDLIADNGGSNGRMANYSSYPTSNAHIQVDSGVGDYLNIAYGARSDKWFNFTDIETVSGSAPVPEPASCALLALALGGVGAGLRRRRK